MEYQEAKHGCNMKWKKKTIIYKYYNTIPVYAFKKKKNQFYMHREVPEKKYTKMLTTLNSK